MIMITIRFQELKANTISSSFKQFKKEILLKSENSRTGQIITQAQILQFEQSEQKHEEDLEKVSNKRRLFQNYGEFCRFLLYILHYIQYLIHIIALYIV